MYGCTMSALPKHYLGDSVYAEWNGHQIVLTTENGFGPSNRIVVEPEVWAMLRRYVDWVAEAHRTAAVDAPVSDGDVTGLAKRESP